MAYDQAWDAEDERQQRRDAVWASPDFRWSETNGGPPIRSLRRLNRSEILDESDPELGEVAFLFANGDIAREREFRSSLRIYYRGEGGVIAAMQYLMERPEYRKQMQKMFDARASEEQIEQLIAAWCREVPRPLSKREKLQETMNKFSKSFLNLGKK